jgi:hypothetical protein
MEKPIRLFSRYGEFVELVPLNEHIYKVDFTNNPYSYRIIYEKDDSIKAFDPSGGPFISINSTIEDRKVLKIELALIDNKKELLISLE